MSRGAEHAHRCRLPIIEDPPHPYSRRRLPAPGSRHVVMLALRRDQGENAGELIGLLVVHFRESAPLPDLDRADAEA